MISVVMPSLNSADFLPDALTSVLRQEVDLEVVVQDGGSVDATSSIILSFEDERIRFASCPDDGQSDAINRAVARARGDWIIWLNADDMLVDGALALVSHALTADVDLVYGDAVLVNRRGQQLRYNKSPTSLSRSYILRNGAAIFSGSMVIRKSRFIEWGALDAQLAYCMDFDFLARIADLAQSVHVPVPVGAFRIHDASKSSKTPWNFLREYRAVRRRFAASNTMRAAGLPSDLKLAIYIATSRLRYSRAWSSIRTTKQR